MRIRYNLVNIRKIVMLSVLLLCCRLGVGAQGFVDLTADEVRIDSPLPVYTWQKPLGRHYADSTYTVSIDKASPVFAFEQAAIEAEVGKAVPENKLTIQMYDGAVKYTSSNEDLATVDANGVVTAKAEGEVTIIATGPETLNCFEAMKAEYKLTIKGEGAGVSSLTLKAEADKAYDLQGRKLNAKTARKGVVIVDGKKIIR